MEHIFHEKQEGSLCAQHCLNALLQGSYFTPVDLASLAQKMDDEERLRMAESGIDSEEYRRFIEQPSGNMDDSGYFSVQVISSALEVWGLELIPFNSTEPLALAANQNPESMSAYICNYRDHWFTIRKLGHQWFNLNSLLSKPQLISTTYLSIFLAQLQQEGYSIFIVVGNLPDCKADDFLRITPAVPEKKKVDNKEMRSEQDVELEKAIKLSMGEPMEEEDEELKTALQESLVESDPSLTKAIQLSLQLNPPTPNNELISPDSISIKEGSRQTRPVGEDSDEDLRCAIRLSLEGHSESPSTPRIVNIPIVTPSSSGVDLEEVRRRRLAFLEHKAASGS